MLAPAVPQLAMGEWALLFPLSFLLPFPDWGHWRMGFGQSLKIHGATYK